MAGVEPALVAWEDGPDGAHLKVVSQWSTTVFTTVAFVVSHAWQVVLSRTFVQ